MKSEILHTSYVIDFLDVNFNSNKIGDLLKAETDLILKKINIESLEDWTIQFNVVYGSKTKVLIYKGMPSYKIEKVKLITIHIPVPCVDVVEWGVLPSQHIKIGGTPDDKGLTSLEVKFNQFRNVEEYIIDCLKRAIRMCFLEGFTVNKAKVKLKSSAL